MFDFSNAINVTPQPLGKNSGDVKIKKWDKGTEGDKNARWRSSRCPWEHSLHEQWKRLNKKSV